MSKNPANTKSTDSEGLELENEKEIQILTDKVEELYDFKFYYFETHDISSASNKTNDIKNELSKLLEYFDDNKVSKLNSSKQRAKYYYLKGKALNISDTYDKQSEEYLSKAIKLDPNQVDCWNELGECYWKKSDIEEAKSCFTAALNYSKNKKSLRNLSMLLRRQSHKSPKEQNESIEKGVRFAKEAVQLDPNDGLSWSILGNAHLAHFFKIEQNPKTMKLCLSSYNQAEKDKISKGNPDLYYNKAIASKYEENYLESLECFNKSHLLEPTWNQPKTQEEDLLNYLEKLQELIDRKGKMKSKKLSQLLQSLDDKHIKNQHIKWSSSSGPTQLEFVPITSLDKGLNDGKAIEGKVVCSINHEDAVAFTFCLIDKSEQCVAVTLYNIARGKGVIIGDTVCVPSPYLNSVNFQYKNKTFCFNSIRVDEPLSLLVNGKTFAKDQVAPIDLKTHMKPE